jgi:hypothetical protein
MTTPSSIRLVQLIHPLHYRRVALVQEPVLKLLRDTYSVYDLALEAILEKKKIREVIGLRLSSEQLDYTEIYEGRSEWKLLPSFDHPGNPFACNVSGTGLTHKNSALNRQMMHQVGGLGETEGALGEKAGGSNEGTGVEAGPPTDSMRMYQWGVGGGNPPAGTIGTQPEWFHKGNGTMLRAHGEPLIVPSFGDDGGEEPEIAGIYVVDEEGAPWRIGFSTANEFSDHVMEKKNYLYLAPSKLRTCSIGPEVVLEERFSALKGTVGIRRQGQPLWSSVIHTGQEYMAHSLANLEYHHFKYDCHRIPFQAHIHFFGADAFSFGNKIVLQDADVMEISWEGMGRTLKNPLRIVPEKETWFGVEQL